MVQNENYRMQDYYSRLSAVCFPTVFVTLTQEEIEELAAGNKEGMKVGSVLERIAGAVKNLPSPRFISVDTFTPDDTVRFKEKKGAVSSPESIWNMLCESNKVKAAAAEGKICNIVIRPFRRMDEAREFRVFIKDGKFAGMSQYHLVRHFRRLVEREQEYMSLVGDFVKKIAPFLPAEDIVADIYITHTRRILLIDLNPWGKETDALMLKWDMPWDTEKPVYGIVPAPRTISGEVEVKF
ncbi:MAG: hypothetical protein IKA79_01590 [Lentisphaeria bacterium]|nr:hypothetical protein [Lentisphaeria bacterium]